jgi:uncharacterized membrane protein YhiD involved in acid resistance
MVRKLTWLVGLWAASVVAVGAAAFMMRALLPH